jgi:CNT family concentrative nucleoside transporter
MGHLIGVLGIAVLLAIALALSSDRRRISLRTVSVGVGVQLLLAYLMLRFPPVSVPFDAIAAVVARVISFADEGTAFIFGNAADAAGPWGFIFAVKVLPIIIFFASLMSVLYHIGVMQRVIAALAWAIRAVMGVTGTESLSAAANIFVGQTEAPLTIRPFIAGLTRSQVMCVMTCGFATIAGSVMAAYIALLGGQDGAARILVAKHFITASVMSAPAAIVMAKIMMPEAGMPREESLGSMRSMPRATANAVDAAAVGAGDGLRLALNVAAMLVAFVALIALLNYPLASLSQMEPVAALRQQYGIPVLSFQNILGMLLKPLAWCMGAGPDSAALGSLMGQQVIATEFVAYADLARMRAEGGISPRAAHIATFALCGFANLPSIAIQIGGLSALAPERRSDFAAIGPRAMVAGALACWMTGAVASVFLPA